MSSDLTLNDLFDYVTDYMIYACEASSCQELAAFRYYAFRDLDAFFKVLEDSLNDF